MCAAVRLSRRDEWSVRSATSPTDTNRFNAISASLSPFASDVGGWISDMACTFRFDSARYADGSCDGVEYNGNITEPYDDLQQFAQGR